MQTLNKIFLFWHCNLFWQVYHENLFNLSPSLLSKTDWGFCKKKKKRSWNGWWCYGHEPKVRSHKIWSCVVIFGYAHHIYTCCLVWSDRDTLHIDQLIVSRHEDRNVSWLACQRTGTHLVKYWLSCHHKGNISVLTGCGVWTVEPWHVDDQMCLKAPVYIQMVGRTAMTSLIRDMSAQACSAVSL